MTAPTPADAPDSPAAAAPQVLEVHRRSLPALTVAVAIHRGGNAEIPAALQRWEAQVRAAGLQVDGAPLAIFAGGDRDLDMVPVRLCVPVRGEVPAALGVRSAQLDPVEVIEVRYVGPYSGIGAAYDALCQWLESCEWCVAQGVSETLRGGPSDSAADGIWTFDVTMRLCGSGNPSA